MTNNEIKIDAYFSESKRNITDDFIAANITTVFGSTKLDLRQAHIRPQASVKVAVAFGSVKIMVPKNCRIKYNGTEILAEFSDNTNPAGETIELEINGSVVLGELEIIN